MERYLNKNRNSGVAAYEIGGDYLKVKFNGAIKIYKYSYQRAGQIHVENMKSLAIKGEGLNSYIKRHVNNLYD